MTPHEIYRKVRTHLLEQGKKSRRIDPGDGVAQCAYRGTDGTSCAVGCLIPDEAYSEALEGETLGYSPSAVRPYMKVALLAGGVDTSDAKTVDLLSRLQNIHDSYTPSMWEDRLNMLSLSLGWSP